MEQITGIKIYSEIIEHRKIVYEHVTGPKFVAI